MPSKTAKQARLMRAAAHNPKVVKSLDIPRKVAKEYVKADQKNKPKNER